MTTRIILGIALMILTGSCQSDQGVVEQAVRAEMSLHPKSRLVDIYKYFFQDVFGPGHLNPDSTAAAQYIEREIREATRFEDFDIQPLQYKRQFVRLNLRLVHNGEMEMDSLVGLFLRSGEQFTLPAVAEWRKTWKDIVQEIERMDLDLPEFENDRLFIDSLLEKGDYVVHHSPEYIQTYDPHYRLIQWEFIENLMPIN